MKNNYIVDRISSLKNKKFLDLKIDKKNTVKITLGTLCIATPLVIILNNIDNDLNNKTFVEEIPNEIVEEQVIQKNYSHDIDYLYDEYKILYDTEVFHVGTDEDKKVVLDYFNNPKYNFYKEYSKMYGVDPVLMATIGMQETRLDHYGCIPGGNNFNGCGIGIMQIEKNCNNKVTAYNYKTGEYDTVIITDNDKENIETNIKVACMLMQNNLEAYNGNVYLAIQAYNYGQTKVNVAIRKLSEKSRWTVDDIKKNYSMKYWKEFIDDIHNNPYKYDSSYSVGDTYGDNDYIEHVLRYCPKDEVEFYLKGEKITFNLKRGLSKSEEIKQR